MLLFVLALDSAGFMHGDISANIAALIALIVGVLALVLDPRVRGAF